MYILDVNNNDKGQLYTQRFHLPNGQFLIIKHTLANKLSLTTKQINFIHVSFNRIGDRLLACDLHGNIYMFDLNYNRYMRLNRIGTSCTALAYNLKCKTEYLVATVDGTIKCFNAETRDLVGWMKGHEKPIISLSVHSNGELVISFSSDIAQLWDLKTFECKQKLNINSKHNVEIMKISFSPSTNDIISVFKDDTIYVWSSENVELKCQLSVPEKDMISYKCYSVSSDGKVLVTAGRSNNIHVWSIENHSLTKTVRLNDNVESVKECLLLPGFYENKILVLLTQDGLLEAYNLETDKYITCLNNSTHQTANEKLIYIFCSSNARYLSAISENGFIQVYDLDCSNLSKYKSTNALMKSTINSTSNNNTRSASLSASASNHTAASTSSTNRPGSSSISSKMKQKYEQKQVICKRAQTILNNEQIYTKLVQILKCYGEYPSRYRMFIWKMLLKLPENYDAYAALIEKGIHPAFIDIHKKYPVKSQKCNRLLQRTLSVLAHWAPLFAECEYLPLMVFPFVKLFQNNHVVCFEIVVTFLNNWCQHWFELFPNPPMNILNMIENLIAYHDRVLIDHFMRYRITSQIFGWPLLETIFSEVFSKNEWQILFDNIFSNHPGYLIYLAAAYSICNRTSLLRVTELDDAKYFYHHRNPLSVKHLIRESTRMQQSTPSDIDPVRLLLRFEPLGKGNYPVFNKRPKFISDYQVRERKKILQEEIDYLKEREQHLESHKQNEGRKLENEYILKQLLWDKRHNSDDNKPKTFQQFKQALDNYDEAQQNIEINVAGEPVQTIDSKGITFMNKMRNIDENFDEIENALSGDRKKTKNNVDDDDDDLQSDFDIDDLENEMLRSGNNNNTNTNINNQMTITNKKQQNLTNNRSNSNVLVENSIKTNNISNNNINNKKEQLQNNRCLNETEATSISTSTMLSLDRGRNNLENQERELMKRVYELRKTIAYGNRKAPSSIASNDDLETNSNKK